MGNRPYPTEGLESLLREEFGEGSVMSDITDVRLVSLNVVVILPSHKGVEVILRERIKVSSSVSFCSAYVLQWKMSF